MITNSLPDGHSNQPMSVSDATYLIRYLEVWRENDDRDQPRLNASDALVFSPTVEGVASSARRIDVAERTVGAGEGIAGSAWKQDAPVVIQDEGSVMMREACERSGVKLNALVAIPFVNDNNSVSIVVFGIADGFGGLEVWSRDDRDELSISGSYYEGLESFEFISQYVRFPRGSGLPGNSWKQRRPNMVKDPGVDANFIRTFAKDPADLSVCLGIPVASDYGSEGAVLLMLSSTQQPMVRQIDILRCESATPSQDNEFPTVKLTQHDSATDSRNGVSDTARMQAACDRLSQARNVILLPAGDPCVPTTAQASLLVPFFSKNQISSILQLSF